MKQLIMVIINSSSGQGKALKWYNKHVKDALQNAYFDVHSLGKMKN
jgi:hypothetical protein